VANIFFVVKVADDGQPNGTGDVAYSDGHDIFLADSVDKGTTWSQAVKVNHGTDSRTSLFPWLETGAGPGSVGVVWYGTSSTSNVDGADWNAFYAQSYDATSANPTFRQVTASDHFIHDSNISTGGTLGTANRNLLDYFQVSFDPNGAAVIAYTDDHNDYDGHTYVTHQIGGPGLNPTKSAVPSPRRPVLPARLDRPDPAAIRLRDGRPELRRLDHLHASGNGDRIVRRRHEHDHDEGAAVEPEPVRHARLGARSRLDPRRAPRAEL